MKLTTALLCFAGVLSAQPAPAPTPVIQTETREVLVDAIVTAKNGTYIRDLTAKDFHLSQDGKEQTIKGFSLESATASAQPRSLVLFFDETSMEPRDQVAVRQAAARFIDAQAGANHMMAVVTFDGSVHIVQNFTNNGGRLKESLNQATFHGLAPSASDSDRSHDPSRVEEDRAVGRGAAPLVNAYSARNAIRALGDLGRSLGVLPGRKIVILFAGALPSSNDPRTEAHEAVEAANKSGVAFYAVDVRPVFAQTDPGLIQDTPGTRSGGGRGSSLNQSGPTGGTDALDVPLSDSGSNGQQLLFNLAGGTGGFVVRNTTDLLGGLESIGEEEDQYYALTYVAPEAKEGSCHSLRVKVDRKGTTVRSRTSYCTSRPLDLLAGTAAAKDLEKHAEAAQTGDIAAFVQLPYFYIAPNVARVHVAMEIQADNLKFETKKGKSHAELNFLGIAAGADGEVRARFSDTLKLDFDDPSQIEHLKGKSLHYEKEFKIVPGQYNLTIAFSQGQASSTSETSFGKLQVPLAIDPWTGDFGLSGLALSRETHPAADLGLGTGLEGRTPLVADGVQVVPTGAAQFLKSESASFYCEIYGPDLSTAHVRVRVLDARTGEQKSDGGLMNLPASSGTGRTSVPLGARLPLDSLSPGSYQLEVTAVNAAGQQLKRTADFIVTAP